MIDSRMAIGVEQLLPGRPTWLFSLSTLLVARIEPSRLFKILVISFLPVSRSVIGLVLLR